MTYSDRVHDIKPRPIKAASPVEAGETLADYVARINQPPMVLLDVHLLYRRDQ